MTLKLRQHFNKYQRLIFGNDGVNGELTTMCVVWYSYSWSNREGKLITLWLTYKSTKRPSVYILSRPDCWLFWEQAKVQDLFIFLCSCISRNAESRFEEGKVLIISINDFFRLQKHKLGSDQFIPNGALLSGHENIIAIRELHSYTL